MLDPHKYSLFIMAALVLLVIPGPSVLYITARSIDQGKTAGLISVFGNALGSAILVLLSAFGLSAIIASLPLAFNIVKYLGAAYLIYLGIKRLLAEDKPAQSVLASQSLSSVFFQGTSVAVLNPKTTLFFLAFLPQFVEISRGYIWAQILLLGLTLVGLGIITDSVYALLAGTIGNWLKQKGGFPVLQRYFASFIYILLGVLAVCYGFQK
jgi:threonine/homoserine/homoserine lactone efflux protein